MLADTVAVCEACFSCDTELVAAPPLPSVAGGCEVPTGGTEKLFRLLLRVRLPRRRLDSLGGSLETQGGTENSSRTPNVEIPNSLTDAHFERKKPIFSLLADCEPPGEEAVADATSAAPDAAVIEAFTCRCAAPPRLLAWTGTEYKDPGVVTLRYILRRWVNEGSGIRKTRRCSSVWQMLSKHRLRSPTTRCMRCTYTRRTPQGGPSRCSSRRT